MMYYDISEENQWLNDLQITGRRPQPCSFHSLTAVGDRAVLIGGLNNNDQHLNEIHIFDPSKLSHFTKAICSLNIIKPIDIG